MIKNLIFDFGGVLINLDKEIVPQTIQHLGRSASDMDLLLLSTQYEKGVISTENFLRDASLALGLDGPELSRIWNRTILDFPEHRLAFLENLKSGGAYRMFLLSNTNELHIDFVRREMGARYQRFQDCFHGFYLSYEMGMRKPEPEIFMQVLKDQDLRPEETLFIDDTLEHILGAASVGLHTWHLDPETDEIVELPSKLKE